MIRVVKMPVGSEPFAVDIDDGSMAAEVGGPVQRVPLDAHGLSMWCAQGGRLHGEPINFVMDDCPIVGDVFFGRVDDKGAAVTLVREEIDQIINIFQRKKHVKET